MKSFKIGWYKSIEGSDVLIYAYCERDPLKPWIAAIFKRGEHVSLAKLPADGFPEFKKGMEPVAYDSWKPFVIGGDPHNEGGGPGGAGLLQVQVGWYKGKNGGDVLVIGENAGTPHLSWKSLLFKDGVFVGVNRRDKKQTEAIVKEWLPLDLSTWRPLKIGGHSA